MHEEFKIMPLFLCSDSLTSSAQAFFPITQASCERRTLRSQRMALPPARSIAAPSPPLLPSSRCNTNLKYRRTTTTASPPQPTKRLQPPLLRRPLPPDPPQLPRHPSTPENTADSDGAAEEECSSTPTDVLRLMDALRVPVDTDTYAALLKECADRMDLVRGVQVHAHIKRTGRGLVGPGVLLVANRLLLMYASCGDMVSARELFDKMPVRDSITWATIIVGCSDTGEHSQAISVFVEMLERGDVLLKRKAGRVCVAAVLRSCAESREYSFGQSVHALVLKTGSMEQGLAASVVQFYGTGGCVHDARRVFDLTTSRSSSLWLAIILAYYRHHMFRAVVEVFRQMRVAGKRKATLVVLPVVLKACGRISINERAHGRQAHASAIKAGVEGDEMIQCGLVEMYGRMRLVEDARKAFEMKGRQKSAGCWDSMLRAYTRKGRLAEAVRLLFEMKASGVEPQESMLKEIRLVC